MEEKLEDKNEKMDQNKVCKLFFIFKNFNKFIRFKKMSTKNYF